MFRFSVVVESLPYLLEGLRITLLVTASALLASLVLGFLVGTMRLSSVRIVALSASLFVIVLRNTPLLVQLIWVYYCLPIVFGLDLSAVAACVLALSLHGGAYIAEIVRAGIQSIDPGQTEAAKSVGLNYWQTMIHVILPQAIRRIIPPLANEGITLLKYSSLVSTIGVADLTYQAQVVATTTFRPLEIYTALALEYFVLCSALQYCTSRIEAAFADRG
jgi:His/Glu/Gln/Arg/opine family amino acid ABC transporter permease subunit